jgi:hypothetical protein
VIGKIFKKRLNKRAISPVISTVILTGAIIAILGVTLTFANGLLWSKIAESDFNSAKQFMQTTGLQIDDVAWTVGRTETIQYSSKYGDVTIEPSTLNYTVYVKTNGSSTYNFFASYEVGVLLFNVPISRYSISNGYWERIFPSQDATLTLKGTSAPVTRVFAVEKMPMNDGNYIRVVVAPAIRALSSSINSSSSSTYYVKLYLPVLNKGETPRLSKSVTLTGKSINATTTNSVTSINVTVSFPRGSPPYNFDDFFFKFPSLSESINVPPGYSDTVLEFYASEVTVDFGINY